LPGRKSSADGSAERDELRLELERLARENAELRARAIFDEQLNSDAARYEVIVANLAEGVVLHHADGPILTCNSAAERILGLSVDQMMGRSSMDPRWRSVHEDGSAFPGETHPAMVSLRTGVAMHDVVMGVHKPDATLTWISIHSQPLFEPGRDRPYAVVASFVDITSHKQAEARARDSEGKLRFALHSARMGTWEWDLDSGKLRWSDDVESILGLEPGSFTGSLDAYLSLVHPEDRSEVESSIQRSFGRDESREKDSGSIIEHRVLQPDGTARWVASFGRVIRDERGEPLGMAGTVADISARKSLEDQLMLSQRMETVGRLAGGVAHDFNNLLTAILGCAEFVEARTKDDALASDALEIIREASEKAAGLTRQLLSFARKQVFNLELLDLRELVANTERLLSRIIGENIQIRTELGDTEVLIRADRAQIEQVLINLAVNARDAMPLGGSLRIAVGIVTVESSTSTSLAPGRHALLEVCDRGQGIAKATLPHIFDPFFTTKTSGTGLGLSTCYGIVKQLGGDISVDSELGGGTCFAIYLPLTNESIDDVHEHALPIPPWAGGRILLVEDDAVVRRIAQRGLQAHGYEVLAASDGLAALQLLAMHPSEIDLLVSDIVMPNMTGYELAERLQQQRPGLTVLFVSGYDDAFDREGAPQGVRGASYLPKPYTVSRLAEVVGQLLTR
jgi:two-component system cell cycle sensor histidine kinase/response regulator CckA